MAGWGETHFDSQKMQGCFLHQSVHKVPEAHRTSSFSIRTDGFASGVQRPRREADYSNPSRTEIRNEWSFTSITSQAWIVYAETPSLHF
jgi:hypothetical protein